jgi:hypothetical protein
MSTTQENWSKRPIVAEKSANSITSFDELPTEARFLMTMITSAACARLAMTESPSRTQLAAVARRTWDGHGLTIEALKNPEALSDKLWNYLKKQLIQ